MGFAKIKGVSKIKFYGKYMKNSLKGTVDVVSRSNDEIDNLFLSLKTDYF